MDDVAPDVVEEVDCLSDRKAWSGRNGAEGPAENGAMSVSADILEKESHVFPRLPFAVEFVHDLGHSFRSDQVEEKLKRWATFGYLVQAVSEPKHPRGLLQHDPRLAPGHRNCFDTLDEGATRLPAWEGRLEEFARVNVGDVHCRLSG